MDQQDALSDQPSPASQSPEEAAAADFSPLPSTTDQDPAQSIDLLRDVPLRVSVELGRTRLFIRDVLALRTARSSSSIVKTGAEVDILVNGTLIAKGEVVVVDERFGVRISEVVRGDHLSII